MQFLTWLVRSPAKLLAIILFSVGVASLLLAGVMVFVGEHQQTSDNANMPCVPPPVAAPVPPPADLRRRTSVRARVRLLSGVLDLVRAKATSSIVKRTQTKTGLAKVLPARTSLANTNTNTKLPKARHASSMLVKWKRKMNATLRAPWSPKGKTSLRASREPMIAPDLAPERLAEDLRRILKAS
ncbi:hypothetical protein L226DRAFT_573444 [Lentinus tigrinus ALCF2SS1-7]|nr:hypothetical protein L226DRAFT_573444 [Lentinus tigrinus ALCF2SS1-7]